MAVEGVSITLSQWAGLSGPSVRAPVENAPTVKTVAPTFDEVSAAPIGDYPPPVQKGSSSGESTADNRGGASRNGGGGLFGKLSDEEKAVVSSLKKQDAEVKRHERAHVAAGGPYTGLPVYQYTQGPDGKQYAVSGEVSIDASPQGTPEATIAKMEVVKRAALAPAEPSAQDRAVAAQAQRVKAEAEARLHEEKQEESQAAGENGSGDFVTGGISPASAVSAYSAFLSKTSSDDQAGSGFTFDV